MTPDYALSLSFGGIALLTRAALSGGPRDGWYSLGEVALDVEDLAGALAILREEALADPRSEATKPGPEVKLILPGEQIKFLSVPRDGGDEMAQIEAVLRDATPYAVADLVYDWHVADDQLHIAAVARETLGEAESFAREHLFEPLCFVAGPSDVPFPREPFFGVTETWAARGEAAAKPVPDARAATVIPGAPPPRAPIAVESAPVPARPRAEATSAERNAADKADRVPSEPPAGPLADPTPETAVGVSRPEPAPSETPSPEQSAAMRDGRPDLVKDEPPAPSDPTLGDPHVVPEAVRPVAAAAPTPEAEPPMAFASLRATRGTPEIQARGTAPDPHAEGLAPKLPAPGSAPAPTEPSEGTATPTDPALSQDSTTSAPIRAQRDAKGRTFAEAIKARALENGARAGRSDTEPPLALRTADLGARDGADADKNLREPLDAPGPTARQQARSVGNVLARAQSGLGRGIGFISRRDARETGLDAQAETPQLKPAPGGAAGALAAGNKMDEAARMTVFGARRQAQERVGGKPRFLGLMLTAALLIFLLAVAAWASIFVDEGLARFFKRDADRTPPVETALTDPAETTERAEGPPDLPAAPTALALPEEVTDTGDTAPASALSTGLPATTVPPLPEPDGLARPWGADALSPEEAEVRYAATGIWQRSPLPPAELREGLLEDLTFAALDQGVQTTDPSILPSPRAFATDIAPPEQGLPPRADQRFNFDDRGLIRPDSEGVVTPDGYRLVLGRPDLLPPARGGLAEPAAPEPLVSDSIAIAPSAPDASAEDLGREDVATLAVPDVPDLPALAEPQTPEPVAAAPDIPVAEEQRSVAPDAERLLANDDPPAAPTSEFSVEPVPGGVVTPDGFTLVRGRPDIVPPARATLADPSQSDVEAATDSIAVTPETSEDTAAPVALATPVDPGPARDADGLILPSPEGVVAPEGYTLVLGRPGILPPERAVLPEPAPADVPEPEAILSDPVLAEPTPPEPTRPEASVPEPTQPELALPDLTSELQSQPGEAPESARDGTGLIRPTAEGVVTPEGYTLLTGRPGLVPPARPAPAPTEAVDAPGVPPAPPEIAQQIVPEIADAPEAVPPLEPTPEGTVSPDGFTLLTGRPGLVPPVRRLPPAPPAPDSDVDSPGAAPVTPVAPEVAAPLQPTPDGTVSPEGFTLLTGRPGLEPPVRPVPPAPAPDTAVEAPGAAPVTPVTPEVAALLQPTPDGTVSPDGFTLLTGRPGLVPPVRPAPSVPAPPEEGVSPNAEPRVPAAQDIPEAPAVAAPLQPTLEGTVSPEGYTLLTGRPGLVPPTRSVASAPAPAPAIEAEAGVPPLQQPSRDGVVTPEGYTLLLGRPGIVPPVRAGLPPEDDAADADPATPGAVTLAALATPSPPLRPDALQARFDSTEEIEAEAPTPAIDDTPTAEVTEDPPLPTSRLAVLQSAAPQPRPNNMPRIVRRADRAEEAAPTQVASIAPRTVQPPAPSRQSVARAATQNNAINLRRVNLIGVYGKPSDRRALVRLANGRFQKVKVGDRLDGGRIVAISDDELRYQKGGRNVTLNLPQS